MDNPVVTVPFQAKNVAEPIPKRGSSIRKMSAYDMKHAKYKDKNIRIITQWKLITAPNQNEEYNKNKSILKKPHTAIGGIYGQHNPQD